MPETVSSRESICMVLEAGRHYPVRSASYCHGDQSGADSPHHDLTAKISYVR